MKKMGKKWKLTIVAFSLATVTLFSSGFTDNFFEISKNLDIFATLFRELNTFYVDDTEPGELIKSGIDGMLRELDPYTNYIPASQIEDFMFMTTGQYGGIGSLIRAREDNDYVMIAEPYEGFPAFKAGLKAGDLILEVDGQSAKGKSTSELSNVLKGQPKTNVKIKVQRGEADPFEVDVVREEIKINDVPYYGFVKDSIGYIKLTSFTRTASKEVKDAFHDLKSEGMKSLIFDLRGNGGGLLKEAISIVNMFVPKGSDVVHTKGKIKDWDNSHTADGLPTDTKIPLIVLIDESSASASEIVSGALQDLDRAVIVGRKSYGKGLVQQTRNLSYDAKLKVTVAKYYLPSGRLIQRIDYSHRDEYGKAGAVPDSLIQTYYTKNGRPVKDGQGILPDIKIEEDDASLVLQSLATKLLLFDFATQYASSHDSIPNAGEFELTQSDFDALESFLQDKDYSYKTESEDMLERLEKIVTEEEYIDELNDELEGLKAKLLDHKKQDLNKHRTEVMRYLQNEIVSRYYYQSGRIENSLSNDLMIEKAVEIFNESGRLKSILQGPSNQAQPKD